MIEIEALHQFLHPTHLPHDESARFSDVEMSQAIFVAIT
jgi:hypothetical protein